MNKRIFFIISLLCLLFVSCQPAPEATPTLEPPTPEPTKPPPEPTATKEPTPQPTATPIGQIFRDDFSFEMQPGWMWINEIPENHSLSNKGLRIVSDDLCLLGNGTQNNLLMFEAPQDASFQIETKVIADTTSNFQQASLFLYEDAENYYSVNRGYCGPCTAQGDGIYSDYMYHNEINFSFKGIRTDLDEVYLKIVVDRESNWLINYYAFEQDKWIQLRKVPLLINVNFVGLGACNSDDGQYDDDLIAFFDYFEISALD